MNNKKENRICQNCKQNFTIEPEDYAFSKPFFTQWRELQESVPRVNLYRDNFILSDYCNYGLDLKECYLVFGGRDDERVYFGNQVIESRDSMEVAFSEKIEFSYEIFECARTNKLFFSRYSTDSLESYYLLDCRNCMNCFGGVGLVNKQYCIFNQQYTKEKYEEFLKENLGSYKKHLINLGKLRELELTM